MVFANTSSGIVHSEHCEYHPSEENLIIYEELYHALADGYEECELCYGPGFKINKKICSQCNINFTLWDNGCEYLVWIGNQAYCTKEEAEHGCLRNE